MTRAVKAKLEVLADPDALARRVADWLLAAALAKDGSFAVALSGGSTPKRLYALLASLAFTAISPHGRARTGSGATSVSCPKTTRSATIEW